MQSYWDSYSIQTKPRKAKKGQTDQPDSDNGKKTTITSSQTDPTPQPRDISPRKSPTATKPQRDRNPPTAKQPPNKTKNKHPDKKPGKPQRFDP